MEKLNYETSVAETEGGFPPVVAIETERSVEDFIAWYRQNQLEIDKLILKSGAVVFSGLDINTVKDFSTIAKNVSTDFMNYVDGFSPRTKLTSSVYTSTEYDKDFYITLHNELSYSARWPSRLFFCCLIPAQEGGETPLADCRKILSALPADLVAEFNAKGVRYVRNLHGGGGPGPSWQQTYETESKQYVEDFCRKSKIEFTWKSDGGLKLVQHAPAILSHPVTGEQVWFNQIDQFHPVHFEREIYETLMMMYDGNEEELPMFGSFGDGSKISDDMIRTIRTISDETAVRRPWKKGDLVIVDNVLVSHGRMPYKGDRKIVVSMSA
jgi:alpha-ketoglutarate-dependent taurine dioxygenase